MLLEMNRDFKPQPKHESQCRWIIKRDLYDKVTIDMYDCTQIYFPIYNLNVKSFTPAREHPILVINRGD